MSPTLVTRPLARLVELLSTPLELRCTCAPGEGTIEHGVALCASCGKIMVASTAAEILDETRHPRGLADLDELVAAAREAADLLGGRGGGAPLTRVVRARVCGLRLDRVLHDFPVPGPKRGE